MCFRKVRYICVISEKNSTENINLERTNAFTRTLNCSLTLLPFLNLLCWNVLSELLFRAAGYISKEEKCLQEDPVLWGWARREERLMSNWKLNHYQLQPTIHVREHMF